MTVRMLQRRGTASQWNAVGGSVILQSGEIGVNTTDNSFKVGDGSSVWNDLEYTHPDNLNELKYVQLAGGNVITGSQNITGSVDINGLLNITADVDIAADLKVDGQITAETISAGTISSTQINVNNNKIIGLADPTNNTDAVNKVYVDNAIAGLAWKEAVHLIAHGTGANVSLTGNTGTLVIDGHEALVATDNGIYRILLAAQTNAIENGIYLYTDNGTAYTLTRTSDADNISELIGASVYVQEGTIYGTSSWVQSNYSATGFNDMVWVQFSGAALINDGAGLFKDGNTLSVIGTEDRITVTPDNVDIASNYAGQKSITTVGTITATGTADVPIRVMGVAGQETNLQEWITESSEAPWPVGKISKNGMLVFSGTTTGTYDGHYIGLTDSNYDDDNSIYMTSKNTQLSTTDPNGALTQLDLRPEFVDLQSSSSGNEETFLKLHQSQASIIQQDYSYRHRIDLLATGIKFGTGLINGSNAVKEVLSLTQSQIDATSKINVTLDDNVVGLTIKGHSSQTANLQEWKNNSNTTVTSVSSVGAVTANNYNVPVSAEASNSISMNFSGGTGLHTRAANGDVVITASGYIAGSTKTLFITCDSTSRSLTFPSSWIWVGSKPTSIAASKTGVLTVTSLGTAEANAVASWVAQV